MISFIRGKLIEKNPNCVIIEHNGVGFEISVPTSTLHVLNDYEGSTFLLTYLYVKEDVLQLYGFATKDERELFRHLISVSGIGPKLALTILSGVKIQDFYRLIIEGNEQALTALPGVGKKTAQRLIVDLKDKVKSKYTDLKSVQSTNLAIPSDIQEEAILALLSLGYPQSTSQSAVQKAVSKITKTPSLEELVTNALRCI